MGSTAVAHLMRRSEGSEPFEAFMDSYARHDAGRDHDLVLLLKGFDSPEDREWVRRRGRGLVAHELHLPDQGGDISAYLKAARQLPHERLCFLNARTTLTSPGWLQLLDTALAAPEVGVVGASGSWTSLRSLALWTLRLPSAYDGVLVPRRAMRAAQPEGRSEQVRPVWTQRLRTLGDAPLKIAHNRAFPAPHLRTNGFLIDRKLLLSLRPGRSTTKASAHRFECGRRNMTVQLEDRGLAALVVGCDGRSFTIDQWPDAEVFWQGEQANLLIADNQTRTYAQTTTSGRQFLAGLAWAERARPA